MCLRQALCLLLPMPYMSACGSDSEDELRIIDVAMEAPEEINGQTTTRMAMTVSTNALPPHRLEAALTHSLTRGDGDAVLAVRDNSGPAQPFAYHFDPTFAQTSLDTISGSVTYGVSAAGIFNYNQAQYADADALARAMAGDTKITATPLYNLAAAQFALENNPSGTNIDRSPSLSQLVDVAKRVHCYRLSDWLYWWKYPASVRSRPICVNLPLPSTGR